MKIKAPEGVTSVSHDGVQYDADENGCFDVDDNAQALHAHLRDLGFGLEESDEVKAAAKAKQEADDAAAAQAHADAQEAADKAAAEKKAADDAAAEKKAADDKAAADKKAAKK